MFLTYRDFEKVLSLAENSSRNIKRKAKTDPRLLFEKYNCEIIKQTEDFLIVVPLDWECAVFFNSFDCGGEGACWCIGDSDDAAHWDNYLVKKNVFFLIFFVNKHPVYKRKVIIQCRVEHGTHTLWLQDGTESNQIFSPLETAIELIKNSAKLFLGRICYKVGITVIESHAFIFENPTAINIPDSVTTIEPFAFFNCKSLTVINIPDSVTTIGNEAFFDCENLSSIIVGKQNPRFSSIDGVLLDKIENRILHYPAGKQNACYAIPDCIVAIEDNAFFGCKNLTTINIPDSVTTIGCEAFFVCKNLRSITVGRQNKHFSCIDDVLFDKIENRILRYPARKQAASYTIPAGIISIGDSAFSVCENLVTIDIPDSVTTIGYEVFSWCKNLSGITVGKQNTYFVGIDGILFNKIKSRILCYPAGKQATCYTIPAGVTSIGESAFFDCENLVSIDISESVTIIENSAFANCKNLAAVNIPDSVISIEGCAFSGCEKLKEIYLSRQITIAEFAFDKTTEIFYTD
jgi:hypothetical protein